MPRKELQRKKTRSVFYAETSKGGEKFILKRIKELKKKGKEINSKVDYLTHLLIQDGCPAEDLIF